MAEVGFELRKVDVAMVETGVVGAEEDGDEKGRRSRDVVDDLCGEILSEGGGGFAFGSC